MEALRLPAPTYLGIGAADLALTQQVSAATGESRVHHATVRLDYLPGDSASTCRETMLEGYTHTLSLSLSYVPSPTLTPINLHPYSYVYYTQSHVPIHSYTPPHTHLDPLTHSLTHPLPVPPLGALTFFQVARSCLSDICS